MDACHLHQENGLEHEANVTKSVQSSFICFDVRPYLTLMSNEMQTEICSHLPTASLAELARTCRIIKDNAYRVLYLRNAREENSSAVKYAILSTAKDLGEEFALRIIRRAIRYGAQLDVTHFHPTKPQTYATALHMASARGYSSIVKLLLENKASVNLPSRNLLQMDCISTSQGSRIIARAAACLINTREWCSRRVRADLAKVEWFPLLVPLVLDDKATVDLLLEKAPHYRLTSNFEEIGCGALTALHVISATEEAKDKNSARNVSAEETKDQNLARHVLRRSRDLLDEKLPGDGGSALHIALRQRNKFMVQALVDQNVDLNLQTNGLGHAPIHTAITSCYLAKEASDRKTSQEFIELLVNKGADINKTTLSEGYTPLMALVEAAEWDWKQSHINIKQLVDLFIAKGCRINHMTPTGETFAHLLIRVIAEKRGNPSLEALLEKAIDSGAKLDIPTPNNTSIAREYVVDSRGCSRLATLLVKKGARIDDGEVHDVFLKWFKKSSTQDRYKMVRYHKPQISQATINEAFSIAVGEANQEWLAKLRDTWKLVPSNTEGLVSEALGDKERKVVDFVLRLDFDAKYRNQRSRSYLHLIVSRINRDGYSEEVAIQNAKALIAKGTSVLEKDEDGKTAIQMLREKDEELGQKTDRLRLLLLDQKDKELGEY